MITLISSKWRVLMFDIDDDDDGNNDDVEDDDNNEIQCSTRITCSTVAEAPSSYVGHELLHKLGRKEILAGICHLVVDMLGRVGRLMDAFNFVESIPFALDALILNPFFDACKHHGELNLAEKAKKHIQQLPPEKRASIYKAFAYIYIQENRMEEAAQAMEMYNKMEHKKERAMSWLTSEMRRRRRRRPKFQIGTTTVEEQRLLLSMGWDPSANVRALDKEEIETWLEKFD